MELAHLQIDDAFGALTKDVAEISTTVLIKNVVVEDVLTDVFFAGIVHAFEHGVQCALQGFWVGLEMCFHQIDAFNETRICPLAKGNHEPLNPVTDRHAADQAVVQRVKINKVHAFEIRMSRIFPAKKLRDVGVGVRVHELMLFLDEFHFLGCDLLLNLGFVRTAVQFLSQASNLIVVGFTKIVIGEPCPVFSALWR